jgi:hypothetical protein
MAKENQIAISKEAALPVKATATGGETSITAVAATAKAMVEARFTIARVNQRDWDDVRVRLLKSCNRLGFAETAMYSKPVGGSRIEGASIRFAEEAARAMGNLDITCPVLWDDAEKRLLRQTVCDLESNTTYSTDIAIEKTVERRTVRDGQEVVGQRLNTQGQPVYIVRATEDDLMNKQNSFVSKALRTNILRVLPSDIREEAIQACRSTVARQDSKDPDGARKRVVDAFASLHVSPAELRKFLGHEVATSSPKEIEELRAVYQGIRDGETNWAEVLKSKEVIDTTGESTGADKTRSMSAKDYVKNRAKEAQQAGANSDTGELPLGEPAP